MFKDTNLHNLLKFSSKHVLIRRNDILNIEFFFTAEVSRRDTLLFTQVHGEKAITTSKKQVQDKLKELCLTTENGIRPETPDLFAQLVMLMKKLDATSMAEIFEDVKATSYCPNNMQRTKLAIVFFSLKTSFLNFFAILLSLLSKTGIDLSLKTCLQIFLYPEVS